MLKYLKELKIILLLGTGFGFYVLPEAKVLWIVGALVTIILFFALLPLLEKSANRCLQNRNYKDAVERISSLVDLNPFEALNKSAWRLVLLAAAYTGMGKNAEATKTYYQALKKIEEIRHRALNVVVFGSGAMKQQLIEKVEEQVCEMEAIANLQLALLQMKCGMPQKAKSHCDKSLKYFQTEMKAPINSADCQQITPDEKANELGWQLLLEEDPEQKQLLLEKCLEEAKRVNAALGADEANSETIPPGQGQEDISGAPLKSVRTSWSATAVISAVVAIGGIGYYLVVVAPLRQAKDLYEKREYTQAEKEYIQILKRDKDCAEAIANLSAIYIAKGQPEKAVPLITKAAEISKKAAGEENEDYATCIKVLGAAYADMGKFNKAESLLKRSIEILKRINGKEDISISDAVNTLGALYFKEGKFDAAVPYLKEALRLNEKHKLDTATNLDNLASAYNMAGDYSQAEPLFKRALASNPDQFQKAQTLSNLATLYDSRGNELEAEKTYKKALETFDTLDKEFRLSASRTCKANYDQFLRRQAFKHPKKGR